MGRERKRKPEEETGACLCNVIYHCICLSGQSGCFFAGNDVDAFPWLSETRKRKTTCEKREKGKMGTNETQISPKK